MPFESENGRPVTQCQQPTIQQKPVHTISGDREERKKTTYQKRKKYEIVIVTFYLMLFIGLLNGIPN